MLDIDQIAHQQYIPTSVEIKRAILMYLFVGIIVQLSKTQLTVYEYHHLKQSIGILFVGLLVVILTVPLWFIPYGPAVNSLIVCTWIGYGCYLIYQAYKGMYPMSGLYMGVGSWILSIFDYTVTVNHQ